MRSCATALELLYLSNANVDVGGVVAWAAAQTAASLRGRGAQRPRQIPGKQQVATPQRICFHPAPPCHELAPPRLDFQPARICPPRRPELFAARPVSRDISRIATRKTFPPATGRLPARPKALVERPAVAASLPLRVRCAAMDDAALHAGQRPYGGVDGRRRYFRTASQQLCCTDIP